jgi:hypothetical protein
VRTVRRHLAQHAPLYARYALRGHAARAWVRNAASRLKSGGVVRRHGGGRSPKPILVKVGGVVRRRGRWHLHAWRSQWA